MGRSVTLAVALTLGLALSDYAPRKPGRPPALQEVLFPYLDAL